MAVTYDNQASITGSGVTSLDVTIAITTNSNRAAVVGCSLDAGSAVSYTVGGVAASGAIPGCSTFNVLTSVVTAPPSGSQTAHAQWTGAANAVFGVLSASGVNQVTPVNNGTNAAIVGNLGSVTIQSAPGDLTVDHIFVSTRTFSAPTQNLGYNTANGALVAGGSTYGPGTGTATHQWAVSAGASAGTSDGLNLVQAPSGRFVPSILVMP